MRRRPSEVDTCPNRKTCRPEDELRGLFRLLLHLIQDGGEHSACELLDLYQCETAVLAHIACAANFDALGRPMVQEAIATRVGFFRLFRRRHYRPARPTTSINSAILRRWSTLSPDAIAPSTQWAT